MTVLPVNSWTVIATMHARKRLRERWPGLSIENDSEAAAMLEFFVRTGIVLTGKQIGEMLLASGRLRKATDLGVYSPIIEGVIPVDLHANGRAYLLTVFPVKVLPRYRELVDSLKEDLVA